MHDVEMNTGDLQTEEGGGDIPVTRLFQTANMAFSNFQFLRQLSNWLLSNSLASEF